MPGVAWNPGGLRVDEQHGQREDCRQLQNKTRCICQREIDRDDTHRKQQAYQGNEPENDHQRDPTSCRGLQSFERCDRKLKLRSPGAIGVTACQSFPG